MNDNFHNIIYIPAKVSDKLYEIYPTSIVAHRKGIHCYESQRLQPVENVYAFTENEFKKLIEKIIDNYEFSSIKNKEQFIITFLNSREPTKKFKLVCSSDEQQCKDSCQHKDNRDNCPLVTKIELK